MLLPVHIQASEKRINAPKKTELMLLTDLLAAGTGKQLELRTGRDTKKGPLDLCEAFILHFIDQTKTNYTNK